MDYDVIINKPYFVRNFTWDNSSAGSNLLKLSIPSDLLINEMTKVPFKTAAKFRAHIKLIVQVAGTPQHEGILLVSSMPSNCGGTGINSINSMLQAPHVFCAANEATPVIVEIPFYSNVKLLTTTQGDSNACTDLTTTLNDYASVYFKVVNPLVAPTGGSSSVTVSIHAIFTKADFYVPINRYTTFTSSLEGQSAISTVVDSTFNVVKQRTSDFIDNIRSTIRLYTGLHQPNTSVIDNRVIYSNRNFANVTDVPTRIEKLDPYVNHDRIVDEPVFNTDRDEMLLSHILSKPQYLSTVSVSTSTTALSILFSRPITPFQEKLDVDHPYFYTPLAQLAYLSRFWRGSLKLHIQSSMTGFHYAKLGIFKDYSRNTKALLQTPSVVDMSNTLYDTLEFSNGGQVQTVDLPYCSSFEQLPSDYFPESNALQHGIYYIALLQPLVYNGSVSTSVNFNLYISAGDDFQLYGYASNRADVRTPPTSLEGQAEVLQKTSDQDSVVKVGGQQKTDYFDSMFRPIVSARDHIRRFNVSYTVAPDPTTLTNNGGIYTISLSDYVFPSNKVNFCGPSRILRSFYYGNTGGYKFKILVSGVNDCKLSYVPPLALLKANPQICGVSDTTTVVAFNKAYDAMFRHPLQADSADTLNELTPTPFIETLQDNPIFSLDTKAEDGSFTNTVVRRNILYEFTIPQMNVYNFAGDPGVITAGAYSYGTSDVGTLVFGLDANYSDGTPGYSYPLITICPSYGDEARFGYQVICPIIQPDTIIDTSIPYYAGPYGNSSTGATKVEWTIVAPKCYIG